jgi:hypothetical protein
LNSFFVVIKLGGKESKGERERERERVRQGLRRECEVIYNQVRHALVQFYRTVHSIVSLVSLLFVELAQTKWPRAVFFNDFDRSLFRSRLSVFPAAVANTLRSKRLCKADQDTFESATIMTS